MEGGGARGGEGEKETEPSHRRRLNQRGSQENRTGAPQNTKGDAGEGSEALEMTRNIPSSLLEAAEWRFQTRTRKVCGWAAGYRSHPAVGRGLAQTLTAAFAGMDGELHPLGLQQCFTLPLPLHLTEFFFPHAESHSTKAVPAARRVRGDSSRFPVRSFSHCS